MADSLFLFLIRRSMSRSCFFKSRRGAFDGAFFLLGTDGFVVDVEVVVAPMVSYSGKDLDIGFGVREGE